MLLLVVEIGEVVEVPGDASSYCAHIPDPGKEENVEYPLAAEQVPKLRLIPATARMKLFASGVNALVCKVEDVPSTPCPFAKVAPVVVYPDSCARKNPIRIEPVVRPALIVMLSVPVVATVAAKTSTVQ